MKMRFRFAWLPSILFGCMLGWALTLSSQAALKVMTIGDSLTEEYYYEFPFSAPNKAPLVAIPGDANTKNWVEILHERRGNSLDFGSYESSWPFGFSDWRQAGHEYNFGIPGYDTNKWMDILDPELNPFDPDFEPLNLPTRTAMRNRYANMDVVVIMIGGNDVNFQYGDLYDAQAGDAVATAFIANVINNLGQLIDEIRDYNATVPIVLADVPDLGATPDIIGDHPDASKRANASATVQDLNQAVAAFATTRGATLAPISGLTDQLLAPDPIYIGALEMIKGTDPNEDNRPLYLFCWKGLHPSTNGQAIMANTLLSAINSATGSTIPLLTDREIIIELLGLNPDQPFIDWAVNNGLTDLSMTADKDNDGIPSLGEYLLNLDPLTPNTNHLATVQNILTVPTLTLDYTPNPAAARLADIHITQSTNLVGWNEVPTSNLIDLGNGQYQARMPLGNHPGFFRMEFQLKP